MREMSLKTHLLAFAVALCALVLAGCAASPAGKTGAGRTSYLDKVASPGCLKGGAVNPALSPPVLYQGMISCVKAGYLADGVLLFAQAGAYSYYDALRVDTDAARRAHSTMLGEALNMLGEDQRQAFWRAINDRLGNRQQLPQLCRQIEDIGRPVYLPTYLIRPGDDSGGHGDAELWNRALKNYLHCPTDILTIR
ncbi:hypothetical protein [Martelella alba]|uniref:Uncharacterized protein n=1 Tax=Martelella alba TaxID=2590451 RepID=A0ABY2SF65_9HYPH|nr:hypothetical protein [Martelella alba]TKI02803.1 hypothetical protein FCN80_23900 [Martelella alba]